MKSYKMSHFYRKVTAFTLLLLLSLSLLFPFVAQAGQAQGDIILSYQHTYLDADKETHVSRTNISIEREGNIVVRSFCCKDLLDINKESGMREYGSYIFSDKPFTATIVSYTDGNPAAKDTVTSNLSNGIYFIVCPVITYNLKNEKNDAVSGFVNLNYTFYNYNGSDGYGNRFNVIIQDLDLTKDNYKDPNPDTDGTLSNSIPTPKIHVNKDYSFGFDNCTDDYYIQLQGRFWSVDDIELYKENMMWKYRYSSSIKGDLNDWYTAGSKTKANSENLSFLENGQTFFDSFLQQHPVSERNFYGGTNAVGNYFSGYNNALDTIKMLLGQPTSGYNGVDVYVRYFTYTDTGELIYGKWCHYYDDIAKNGSSGSDWDDDDTLYNGQQSENGLTDYAKDENEKNDDPRKSDLDVNVFTPDADYTGNGVAFTGVIELLNSLKSQSSAFLSLFSELFSFLPSWLVSLIYASIGVCCFLGIWHFVRG